MSIYHRIKGYKDSHPKLKSTTIRATEDCLKRVKEFAKVNGIGEGVALWILVEEALEGTDGHEAQKEIDPTESLRKEIDSLNQKVASMWTFMEELTGGSFKDIEKENLNPTPSEDVKRAANESLSLAPEPTTDSETD